uniref:alanine transaminase n=1 Tax=Labrus bergylta TaxID=56723 RepID=A0A3Q3EED0_9LABR
MSGLQLVNPRVKGIRVSSHSELQSLAAQITQQGALQPFKEVIDVSSDDLHKAGMKPVSFVRQVLSVCLYPALLQDKDLPLDVRLRAQRFLEVCDGGSIGSYTASSGMWYVRQSVAEFITRRDAGVPSYAKDVIVRLISTVEGETQTGVLTPLPCPHTIPALLDEAGVTLEPYKLMGDQGWAVDLNELHRALKVARGRCNPRAIYISNPGNPTGHVQDRKSIQEVIQFAAAERLLLLVDEVYQDCVFGPVTEFVSFKRVLFEMGKEYSEKVELVSFHSLSSGTMGECGLRTGYMELINIDPEVKHFVDTCLCTDICAPVTGQLALHIMVNPPTPGDPSYDAYTQIMKENQATLSQNAQRAQEFLNDLPGMSCEPAMGGIYLYPCLRLPPEILKQAEVGIYQGPFQIHVEKNMVLFGCCKANNDNTLLRFHVPPDTLEEVLARLGSFHLRLFDGLPHADRRVKDTEAGQKYKKGMEPTWGSTDPEPKC